MDDYDGRNRKIKIWIIMMVVLKHIFWWSFWKDKIMDNCNNHFWNIILQSLSTIIIFQILLFKIA